MAWTGATRRTVDEWLAGRGPAFEAAIRTTIDYMRSQLLARSSRNVAPIPLHQNPDWQKERLFTACVECLAKIAVAQRITLLQEIFATLSDDAGWEDTDWRRILEKGIDHWTVCSRYFERR